MPATISERIISFTRAATPFLNCFRRRYFEIPVLPNNPDRDVKGISLDKFILVEEMSYGSDIWNGTICFMDPGDGFCNSEPREEFFSGLSMDEVLLKMEVFFSAPNMQDHYQHYIDKIRWKMAAIPAGPKPSQVPQIA